MITFKKAYGLGDIKEEYLDVPWEQHFKEYEDSLEMVYNNEGNIVDFLNKEHDNIKGIFEKLNDDFYTFTSSDNASLLEKHKNVRQHYLLFSEFYDATIENVPSITEGLKSVIDFKDEEYSGELKDRWITYLMENYTALIDFANKVNLTTKNILDFLVQIKQLLEAKVKDLEGKLLSFSNDDKEGKDEANKERERYLGLLNDVIKQEEIYKGMADEINDNKRLLDQQYNEVQFIQSNVQVTDGGHSIMYNKSGDNNFYYYGPNVSYSNLSGDQGKVSAYGIDFEGTLVDQDGVLYLKSNDNSLNLSLDKKYQCYIKDINDEPFIDVYDFNTNQYTLLIDNDSHIITSKEGRRLNIKELSNKSGDVYVSGKRETIRGIYSIKDTLLEDAMGPMWIVEDNKIIVDTTIIHIDTTDISINIEDKFVLGDSNVLLLQRGKLERPVYLRYDGFNIEYSLDNKDYIKCSNKWWNDVFKDSENKSNTSIDVEDFAEKDKIVSSTLNLLPKQSDAIKSIIKIFKEKGFIDDDRVNRWAQKYNEDIADVIALIDVLSKDTSNKIKNVKLITSLIQDEELPTVKDIDILNSFGKEFLLSFKKLNK